MERDGGGQPAHKGGEERMRDARDMESARLMKFYMRNPLFFFISFHTLPHLWLYIILYHKFTLGILSCFLFQFSPCDTLEYSQVKATSVSVCLRIALFAFKIPNKVPGPFARFLQKNDIVAQYSMSGDPQQNGVAERRNRTLMDMVRNMMSYSTLPLSLWIEALKTAIHILNRVPSKSVLETSYELWTGRKPSVNHLRVWGSPAKEKVFNPNIGKLDPKQ